MKHFIFILLIIFFVSNCTMKVVQKEAIYPNVADVFISKDFKPDKVYKIGIFPVINEGYPDEPQSIYSAKLLQQVLYYIPNFKVTDVNIVQAELKNISKIDYFKKATIDKIAKNLNLDLILYSVYKFKYQPGSSYETGNAVAYENRLFGGGAASKDASSKGSEYILSGAVITFYDVKSLTPYIEVTMKDMNNGSISNQFKTQILTEFDLLKKGERQVRRDLKSIFYDEAVDK